MSHKPHALRIETERLKDGPISYDLELTPEELDLVDDPEYTFTDPVVGAITATLVGTTVLLMGTIKTIAGSPCARCLHGLRVPLNAKVILTFMNDDRLKDTVRYPELYQDDVFWYDGEMVYPSEQLRELLLLQLPTVTHCELEPEDFCPVRAVKIEPMVYGPQEKPGEVVVSPDDKSLAAQLARLRKEMGK